MVPLGGDGVSNSVCGIEAVEKQRQSRRRRARIGRGLRRQGRGGEGGEAVEARDMHSRSRAGVRPCVLRVMAALDAVEERVPVWA